METNFNFNYVIQRWEDYHSWFLFSKDGVASCKLCIYDCNPKEGIVSDLFVKDTFRNQGYATALLNFCNKIAKADGCNSISLRSDNDDWVREWYKRIGFEVESSQVWFKKVFNMTRREEIELAWLNKAVQSNHRYDEKTFREAIEWADKTMIEKACEWITEHINIPYEGEFIDDSPVASDYIEWCEKRLEYAKAIADAFKQAMEE